MQRNFTRTLALCLAAGFVTPALADCEQELADLRAQLTEGTGQGVSKDGDLAPLESADSAVDAQSGSPDPDASEMAEGKNEVVKDGDVAPLETDLSNRATSGQQAEARQEGEMAKEYATMSEELKDALDTAEAAMEAGDETACMKAVEKARNM